MLCSIAGVVVAICIGGECAIDSRSFVFLISICDVLIGLPRLDWRY